MIEVEVLAATVTEFPQSRYKDAKAAYSDPETYLTTRPWKEEQRLIS